VDEHLKLDGVPLASDYPLTVCKGEVPGKDQEKEDRKREQRAKISRKSAAYHRARKAVIEQGGTDQEAKAAGKEARLFCLCSCIFSHSPSSTMKLTTSARPKKPGVIAEIIKHFAVEICGASWGRFFQSRMSYGYV